MSAADVPLLDAPEVRVVRGGDDPLIPVPGSILVFAVGYEERSSFVPRALVDGVDAALGVRFASHEVGSFDGNLAWAQSQPNVTVGVAADENAARRLVRSWLEEQVAGRDEVTILVDISSFSRVLLGVLLVEFRSLAGYRRVAARLLYTPAAFRPPEGESGPVVTFGSVIDEMVGVGDSLKRGLALVVGLGYEPQLAMAAQQSFDPTETWLIVPRSADPAYDIAVEAANVSVFEVVDEGNRIDYDVMRPFDAFVVLESMVAGLVADSSVVLLPFGPKILAAVMMLVGMIHSPDVGVWRVSAEQLAPVVDKASSGLVTSIEVHFGPA